MAIDPPYRLDPFQNIVNVHWESTGELAAWIICFSSGTGYHKLGQYNTAYLSNFLTVWSSSKSSTGYTHTEVQPEFMQPPETYDYFWTVYDKDAYVVSSDDVYFYYPNFPSLLNPEWYVLTAPKTNWLIQGPFTLPNKPGPGGAGQAGATFYAMWVETNSDYPDWGVGNPNTPSNLRVDWYPSFPSAPGQAVPVHVDLGNNPGA